jgi:prefoldin subunit 5
MTTEERLDRLERSFEVLTQSILDLRQEIATRLQAIDNRLDVLASTLASLDARQPALTKAILDFGALAAQLLREQAGQKDTVGGLSTRVAKLEEIVPKLIDPAA